MSVFRVTRDPYSDIVRILSKLVRFISMYVVFDTDTVDVRSPFLRTYADPPTIVVGGTAHLPGGRVQAIHVNMYDANNERVCGLIARMSADVPEGEYSLQVVATVAKSTYYDEPSHELLLLARPIRVFDEYLKIPVLYVGSDRSYQAEAVRTGRGNISGALLVAKAVVPRPNTDYENDDYFIGHVADVALRKPARAEPIHYTFAPVVANERVMSAFSGYDYFMSLGDAVTGIGTGTGFRRTEYGATIYDESFEYYALNKSTLNPGLYHLFTATPHIHRDVLGMRVGDAMIDVRFIDIMREWMVGGIDGELYIDDIPFPIKAQTVFGIVSPRFGCDIAIDRGYCVDIYNELVDNIYVMRIPSKLITEIPRCRDHFNNARHICRRDTLVEPSTVTMYGYWVGPITGTFPWVNVYMHFAQTASRFKLRLYVPLYTPFTDGVIRVAFHGRVTVKVLPDVAPPESFMKYRHMWIYAESASAVYSGSGSVRFIEQDCEENVPQSVVLQSFRPMQVYICPPFIEIPVLEIPIRRNFTPIIVEYEPAPADDLIRQILDTYAYTMASPAGPDVTHCALKSDCLNDLAFEWVKAMYAPYEWFYSLHVLRPDGRGTYTGYLPTTTGSYVTYNVSIDLPRVGRNVDVLHLMHRGEHVPYTSGAVSYLAIDEEYRFILG